jgi:hypothetical protein
MSDNPYEPPKMPESVRDMSEMVSGSRVFKIVGEITEADYVCSQWLHMKPRRAYRIAGYAVLTLLLIIFAGIIIEGLSSGDFQEILRLLAPVLLTALTFAHLRWRYHQNYRGQPSLQGIHSYFITDSGMATESSHGKSEAGWHSFTKWREDSNLFLLYKADNLFVMLPKRWLDQASISVDDFRSFLRQRALPNVDG